MRVEEHDPDDNRWFSATLSEATAATTTATGSGLACRTRADKHRDTRERRAELAALVKSEKSEGVPRAARNFKTGVNTGANILRQAMRSLTGGIGIDDVSGETLKTSMVEAARALDGVL